GDMRVAQRIGEPRRLQREVETLGAERIELSEIEMFEDVEHDQRGQALPVGRKLDDVDAAVVRGDRRDFFAAMLGEILRRENAAARGKSCDDVPRDPSAVERGRPLRRNGLQGFGQGGESQYVAGLRSAAVDQEMPGRGGGA